MKRHDRVTLVAGALLDSLLDNELWREAFCAGCEAGQVRLFEECPAGWMPCEPECARRDNWSNISEEIEECVRRSMKA